MNLTRRQLLTGTAGLVATAALAACGRGGDASVASDAAASPSAAGGDFPRRVPHELGTTEVPAPPARVVAGTDGAELAALVALGITPVGFGQRNDPLRPWLRGEVDGVDTYDLAGGETNFEQLAAWQPDLLLVQRGFAEADTYPRFSAVAPTVVTSFIDWRTSLRQTADAVARTDDGEALIAATEEQVAAAAGRLQPYAGLRVGFISVFSGGLVYVMNDQSPVGKLLDELGLQPLPAAVAAGAAVDELPLEQLGSLDVDALFVQRFEPDLSPYEELAAGDLFQRLPAARAGKVVVLEEDESHASYFDAVLTVPLNLAMLERRLGEVA